MDKVLESLTTEKDQNLSSPITTASSSTGVSSMTNPMSPPMASAVSAATSALTNQNHQLNALNAHRLASTFPFVSPAARLEMNLQHIQQQQHAMFPFQQFRGIKYVSYQLSKKVNLIVLVQISSVTCQMQQ